ncbi:class I SAM-dependent methyltransferase [uncultured Arcticibacterium sp.]|uniref:class I SAM-dependent DNA methyltransferase n=1 Tax=uncultured Arcticibacterium sp. TaxID=2173042 RepID=UPI0030F84F30
MKVAFDYIAQDYDQTFTNTLVGKAQRKLVWAYLDKVLVDKEISVLELNCGTGEDAVWLARKGHKVMATDISEAMVNQVELKAIKNDLLEVLSFQVFDIKDINEFFDEQKFDLIFSNFGGFNCLSPENLTIFFDTKLPKLLKPDGKFIGVIMPKLCIWESVFFLSTLQFSKVFRRFSKRPLEANLGNGSSVKTWYYAPKDIAKVLPCTLKVSHKQPIGFFVPPSYVNGAFEKKTTFLRFLESLESLAIKIPFLSKMSDHFLIEIKSKSI